MAFYKYLLPSWKRNIEETSTANGAVLTALQMALSDAEQQALESKFQMTLDHSTEEWLDFYGKIFGVIRKDNENDEQYRARIKKYIKLERSTVPAIIEAIKDYLQDPNSHVRIYEPHTNIFHLNSSKLNSSDHLMGKYYTFAIIDIILDRQFPPGLLDVINEFKPAGVLYRITYKPNGDNENATVVDIPLAISTLEPTKTNLTIANGLADTIRGHMKLTDGKLTNYPYNVFRTNKSKLNSLDVLSGSYLASTGRLNIAGYSTNNLTFGKYSTVSDILRKTTPVSNDFYTVTGTLLDQYAVQPVDGTKDSYLYFALDVGAYFQSRYPKYLREVEPTGVYTKETYIKLMNRMSLRMDFNTATPVSAPTTYSIEVMNIMQNRWDVLTAGQSTFANKTVNIKDLNSVTENMSNDSDLFFRIKLNKNNSTTTYNLQMYYLEFAFDKVFALRPHINLWDGTVTSRFRISPRPIYEYDGGSFVNQNYAIIIEGGSFTSPPSYYPLALEGAEFVRPKEIKN
ncbi:baseplate protein [Bacillus phage vB_BceH_LY2]|nr:baseplate protein [Bacillus phage vB_BceH_LY2]